MATFSQHAKSAIWTEAEVVTVAAGAIISQMMLDERKIFGNEFAKHPEWFAGPRVTAPIKIKFFGGIKAAGATLASTYVTNPWIKLALMGVALQGTIEQLRVMTWKPDGTNQFPMIGNARSQQLDEELRRLAESHRMNGPQYNMSEPEYIGDAGDKYRSAVAGLQLSDRYDTQVAGINESGDYPFSTVPSDDIQAY